jgi:peptidoglycan hydrolase-like protein with peptidoglycan-binding domain
MSTMRPWRELRRGMSGPDVKAAQRGLWRALGAASTNERTGTYGDETARDVARFRAMRGLTVESGGDVLGATVWGALQESFDTSAWVLAHEQPDGVTPTPTLKRNPLSVGMDGGDVEAAQRALWRSLDNDSTNARNGVYGDQTVADVRRFRLRYGVNPTDPSTAILRPLWNALTRWMDQTAIDLAHEAPEPAPVQPAASWDRVGDVAWQCYLRRDAFRYAQLRPMEAVDGPPLIQTDCSGLYTDCCRLAGVPNPNRSDGVFDGYGYTGSLVEHGRWTSTPQRGDAAMYGDPYGSSGHVAVYLGDGSVVSFGHDPMEHYPVRYRTDFRGIRTFREGT